MKHRCVNGKARGARVGMISASLMVIMIMVMAQTALATNYVVSATGSTSISEVDCDAIVNADQSMPVYFTVTSGDSVTVRLNYSYEDTRRGLEREPANHVFTQFVYYNGWGETEAHGYNTTGSASGSGNIQMTLYNVESGFIYVHWWANITCSSPQCSDSDSEDGYIILS